MHITLIRHAEPEWVKDGLNVDNPPLTNRGLEQAELLAASLRDEHFDDIFVSPLLRAQQTARPLLAQKGRVGHTAEWLEEIRNPIWHGTPVQRAEEAYRAERARPSEHRWEGLEGGEPVRDFVARINRDAAEFLRRYGLVRKDTTLPVWQGDKAERRIALVAHAGTNSVTICHLLGLDPTPWEWERFVIGHASTSTVEALALSDGVTFSLSKLSNVEHLPVDHRTF